ncbi:WD40-repeat-containing domain protein [Suillus subaureus]|uniref:WD40-repeat-containing domain protein n=1 Tax=Suillus subaureus TaxID=48587 RepID=A0A9P7E1P5_9AGAM|nr:WD40-repeat-containing domain protein [Suillus subaureus]KAG1808984.1 WD40-repeat-containing domain protein [Suillus subaureus]
MAMSPDESMVVSGSADGRLWLWNIRKGSVVGDLWKGHSRPVRCIDWSPNTQEIVSGSEDGTIRRWNPDTGQQIAQPIKSGQGLVWAVRYSPQGDKFTSGGEDKVICVWSKDGELLIEIEGHDVEVRSLCWSKDGAHIFSASYDHTIRKWRSIDGKELVVFQGHTTRVLSLCLSPDESHLVSVAGDYSVRIWDLKTNQPVGKQLLHDDEVFTVVISPNGKSIVSGGLDGKIYVWSLDAALKHASDDHSANDRNSKPDVKLKGRPVRSRDAIFASQVSRQQPNNRLGGLTKYGNDFWDAGINPTSHPAAPPVHPSSFLRWRDLLGSLHFSTRPPNGPQSIPLEPRRWNFNLFSGGSSIRSVDVPAGRKKNVSGLQSLPFDIIEIYIFAENFRFPSHRSRIGPRRSSCSCATYE